MISHQEVKHIAKLARLGLNEDDFDAFQKDITDILNYFDLLKEVDASRIDPSFSVIEKYPNVLRKDEEKPQLIETTNKLVEAAPEEKDRYIKVKTILK
ncbi:MAG: Asp-tRNA(Asn)/Glu-tRNA(Gln) amidotransferase subunit GatC [Candidatus Pacebacteria bacterium]|nr:Asp-tRNA(Asn)/Glu-tRNA(Gln) amidotransferase subunit GatC [Candidatus Paceibacterota bacterium]